MSAKTTAPGKPIPPAPVEATNSSQEQNLAVERVRDPSSLFYNRLIEGGLDRILRAVNATNKRSKDYSSKVNRDQLVLELQSAHQQLMIRDELDSKRITKDKLTLIQSIANDAMSLRGKLLEKGPAPQVPQKEDEFPTYAARQVISLDDLNVLAGILDKVIISARTRADPADPVYLGFRGARNLTETFLSEALQPIFERHFLRKAGRPRVDGPYIRFAVAVMEEIEWPVSPHTVKRAIKDARAGKGGSYRKQDSPP